MEEWLRAIVGGLQGVGETEGLEAKAKASGASELFIVDLREEFVKDFIFPCLRAGAVYERKYLLGTSMARPIIAKVEKYTSSLSRSPMFPPLLFHSQPSVVAQAMVDVAKQCGADAVSHGCTGKGNDQVRDTKV